MRILYLFRSLAVWGGIERILTEKMNWLADVAGNEVFMLTYDQGTHPVPYELSSRVVLEDLDIRFHQQYRYSGLHRLWDGWQRMRLFSRRLTEKVQKIRPDVIVCTTADPVGVIARVKGSVPLVVESHSICLYTFPRQDFRQRRKSALLERGLRRAACIVALTDDDAHQWQRLFHNVRAIPNMVHLNDGAVADLTCRRVIFVGRFDYQKRPLDIISIWQRVYPRFPDWHLDIYGEGEQQRLVDDEARRLGMNIHVHRPTADIFGCYRKSGLLVSTSLFEPFGLVIPEAMSCGLPFVAYDCPYGPRVFAAGGNCGSLVAMDDAEGFADSMCRLMGDEALRRQMGERALRLSRSYTAERVMPQWQELFRSLSSK